MRYRKRYVSFSEIRSLFIKNNIFRRAGRTGDLYSQLIIDQPATNPEWKSSRSQIIKYFDKNGRHVATSHRITKTNHHHGKDIIIGNVKYIYRRRSR